MCMCVCTYQFADPCFRSASACAGSYHVVMCYISCLLCSCDVQCLVVQGTKCWDRCCSHTTLHFNPSLVALPTVPIVGELIIPTVKLVNLFGGQKGSVCDLSRALEPVFERGEPRSTSGHYQHFWVHYFLDLL